jgi:hypothetical protein
MGPEASLVLKARLTQYSYPHPIPLRYCRGLPGNATNHLLWVLNLITIYLDFSSYNQSYSLHKFTSHNLHCLLFCPASSSVSTELVCRYLSLSCLLTLS